MKNLQRQNLKPRNARGWYICSYAYRSDPGSPCLPKWLHACAVSNKPSTRLTSDTGDYIGHRQRRKKIHVDRAQTKASGQDLLTAPTPVFPGLLSSRSTSKSSLYAAPERIIRVSRQKAMLPKKPLGSLQCPRQDESDKGAVSSPCGAQANPRD